MWPDALWGDGVGMGHHTASLSLPHRAWRSLPVAPRRRALLSLSTVLAPRPDRTPPPASPGLAVAGELSRASGLGEGARLMLAALRRAGAPCVELDLGEPISLGHRHLPLPPHAMPLVLHIPGPALPLALLKLPRAVMRQRRVIAYWAWELPVVAPHWREALAFIHEIWTPSGFAAEAFASFAPHLPIRVVPHPVAVAPPRPSALRRADFGLPEHGLITLVSFSLASSLARKNPLAAIAAHRAAFGNRPDRLLLLKISHAGAFSADMQVIRDAVHGLDNVRIETAEFCSADRHALTACADVVLSLHRSEGFGLVPAEAMLLGVPVVATGWSATVEFMPPCAALLVDYHLIPAIDPRGVFEAPGAVWAEADIHHAASHLRALAADPDARVRQGEAGRAAALALLGDQGLRAGLAALR